MKLPHWDTVRWIRLVLAAAFLVAGIVSNDAVAYAAAGFLGAQAVFNIGCCGMRACQPGNTRRTASDLSGPVTYDELK